MGITGSKKLSVTEFERQIITAMQQGAQSWIDELPESVVYSLQNARRTAVGLCTETCTKGSEGQ